MSLPRLVLIAALFTTGDSALAEARDLAQFGDRAMARAEVWFQAGPTYSQDHCFTVDGGYSPTDWDGMLGGCHQPYYRTDCSGFVSMTWGLSVSYATPRPGGGRDLGDITDPIRREDLRTGDALVASGKHVRLFERWTSRDYSSYLAYDFGETPVKHQEYRWGGPDELAYMPVRYRGA
ncbi:hypothetical protein [Actinokineospora xionganensis]|uniref:NlpC/P60 family protein n=1 Tax=Actinokineospora xionganensis TaxID=2684470 RepID=A0ABR7L5M9_9PSEU|nr:hypothetical protein [Actinokineospora xionganensis]MBC6447754.1 hypothetical protein [Actinokineospora xionganensis]